MKMKIVDAKWMWRGHERKRLHTHMSVYVWVCVLFLHFRNQVGFTYKFDLICAWKTENFPNEFFPFMLFIFVDAYKNQSTMQANTNTYT